MQISRTLKNIRYKKKALLPAPRTMLQVIVLFLWILGVIDESPLLLAAVAIISFFLGPVFCGWLCPIGFLQDLVGKLGRTLQKAFKRSIPDLPAWTKTIRYIVLAAVTLFMALGLGHWGEGGSHGLLFMKIGFIIIAAAGVLWPRFFCRTLCPIGAGLGLFNLIKIFPVKRQEKLCRRCGFCDSCCPMGVPLSAKPNNRNLACISCYRCLSVCPAKDALIVKTKTRSEGRIL